MSNFTTPSRSDLEKFCERRIALAFEQLFKQFLELQGMVQACTGDIVFSAGTTRENAVPANGASLLRTEYANLFTRIGTTYGAVDADHFNVPNVAGRVIAGKEAVASLITSAVSGFSGATLGATGGSQSHTLVVGEIPAHTHTITVLQRAVPDNMNSGTAAAGSTNFTSTATPSTSNGTGGGGAHRNMQPTIILNAFIII